MATMQAALFDGQGEMEVREVDRPEVGSGDALIRVRAVGICGSDLQMNVDKTEPDRLPAGHEVAGEVVAIGEGVGLVRAGQSVVAVEIIGHGRACRTCWYCRQGQFIECQNKAPSEGGGFRGVYEAQGDRLLFGAGFAVVGRGGAGGTPGRFGTWSEAG